MISITTTAPPNPVSPADLDELQEFLAADLPSGYREYMTAYGKGILADFLEVFTPAELLEGDTSIEKWRQGIEKNGWDWDENLLDEEAIPELAPLATTSEGDYLVFHPDDPEVIYLLPAESATAKCLSTEGFEAAITALLDDPLDSTESWDFVPE